MRLNPVAAFEKIVNVALIGSLLKTVAMEGRDRRDKQKNALPVSAVSFPPI